MAEDVKKVFIRPPANWDTMSEQEKFDWSMSLVGLLTGETSEDQGDTTPTKLETS